MGRELDGVEKNEIPLREILYEISKEAVRKLVVLVLLNVLLYVLVGAHNEQVTNLFQYVMG